MSSSSSALPVPLASAVSLRTALLDLLRRVQELEHRLQDIEDYLTCPSRESSSGDSPASSLHVVPSSAAMQEEKVSSASLRKMLKVPRK